jgi:pimeloyl-ACP methyl ester carboxylesterase
MKRSIIICILILNAFSAIAQKQKIYLIAGHGSDNRIYSAIEFPENMDTVHLDFIKPHKNETMHEYAVRLSAKIDTTQNFSIIGVSLGGMLACEMTTFLNPDKVIIISSAAGRNELPGKFRGMKNFQVYRIFAGWFYKAMTRMAQTVFEPDRKNAGNDFDAMIEDKDPDFIKRAIHMLVNWEGNYAADPKIYHIHGTNDHTLPINYSDTDFVIENGSHMMALTRADEISAIINLILK